MIYRLLQLAYRFSLIFKTLPLKRTLFLCLVLLLPVACSHSHEKIRVAATSVPQAEILRGAQKLLKEDGITLQILEVDDYALPNRLLAEKQVDANYFQHKPFLELQEKKYGYKFKVLTSVHLEPMGIYSKKIHSLDELQSGDLVAIPNDPTNERRALELLKGQGLIDFNPTAYPTARDINYNPRSLKIEELDAPLLPRSLQDVTIAVIPSNFALLGRLDPNQALVQESSDSPYANVVVVREDEDRESLTALSKALESKEISDFIRNKYKGAVLPTH